MNDLLARASAFLVEPVTALPASKSIPQIGDLVGVLASPADLDVAATGIASALRKRSGAKTAVVCRVGDGPRAPSTPAATALAKRLAARDLTTHAAGPVCRVAIDPDDPGRDVWRAAAAAVHSPVVAAFDERTPDLDLLLAQMDRLYLGRRPTEDSDLTTLALTALATLGPPTALIAIPSGALARRAAALGLTTLEPTPHEALA